MAVTRRDGGVVTLPSCLQVARHQLAFPFVVAAAAVLLFEWRNITFEIVPTVSFFSFFFSTQKKLLPRVNAANSSNPGTKTCARRRSIVPQDQFQFSPIWYCLPDYMYMYIPRCSSIRVFLACIVGAARRIRVSWYTSCGLQVAPLGYKIAKLWRVSLPTTYNRETQERERERERERDLKHLQEVAWQVTRK